MSEGYATYRNPRLQPPMEVAPPEEPVDVMERCAHRGACERVWTGHVDARECAGWVEEMARILGCDACELFEEG